MKRTLVVALVVGLLCLAGFLVYVAAWRETEYRRLMARGGDALAADETFVAIEAFSGALALKGDSMPAYLLLGEAYRRQGELGTALRHFREAARLDPAAPRPLELIGDINYAMERYARSVESYQACLELDDRSAEVQYKLGLSLYRRGDPAAAIEPLRAAVELEPSFAEAYYLLGLCYADLNRPDEAIAATEEAVRLAPGLVPPREALASLYRRKGDERKAAEVLQALAALEPDSSARLAAVARAYAELGRTDLAVAALSHAAESHPNDPRVYLELGRTWLNVAEQRRDRVALSKALEALERVARGPAASSEALTLLGRALTMSGDLPEALRVLQQATSRFPIHHASFLQLSSVASRSSQPELARDALVRYLALTTDEAETARVAPQAGELSLRLGNAADAVAWFKRALAAGAATPAIFARLAEAQLRAGDGTAARDTVRRGLESDPKNAALLSLSRRLPPEGAAERSRKETDR